MRLIEIKEFLSQHEKDEANSKHATLHRKYKTNGWTLQAKTHPLGQSFERHPNKSKEDWEAFHRNIVHGLKASKHRHFGEYLFYSKSHDHGAIAIVDHKNKHIEYKTILATGRSHSTHENDTKVMVESKISSIICE
jgi:hypothetical protein